MESDTVLYISQAMHGLAYGMVLFLVSAGLTLIFGMMGILNIAHASFFMLGAYFCYQVLSMTGNFWVSLIVAPVIVGLLGVLCERYLLRKLHAYGHVGELLLTVGIGMVILGSVKIFWGTESLPVTVPQILKGLVKLGGLEYPIYRLFIIALALVILAIMGLILYKTRLGMIVRGAVSDAEMVNALGINVPAVFMFVFGFGTWLAGVGGVAVAPILTVYPGLSDQVGMDAFVVVVTAGFGSLKGAFIVSIIFGLLSSFGVQFVPKLAPVLMFGFMAIVLALKPAGIFGETE
ncbi:MAG: branched-chain amino acid ABC transporter permease [Deltaproteobacteria bacterium]|nr:branched-chain amino acid ABC transporter permease [Deltaproteobacteria bacterium]MBW2083539.1 branched-chain amino acid ABC transporter permease [Deltaproteobacteria bacterium]HDM08980.1 branched-chain amino acid ABC transporter permease [Desulfobacteraceae bacterium]